VDYIIIYISGYTIGGMVALSDTQKILISLPAALVHDIDILATAQKTDRSELLKEAIRSYVSRHQKASLAESLKKGYEQMADINLEIAGLCLEADNIQQQCYEEKLAECE